MTQDQGTSKPRTLADLARLADVSEATVSRALSDSPLVNARTKRRIRALADEVGFHVNTSARNLRLKRTQTVAVIILKDEDTGQPISDPFMLEMLGGLAEELGQEGYNMLLSTALIADQDWNSYFLQTKRADGLIIVGQGARDNRLKALAAEGTPFVVWGAQLPDANYATVGTDNALGASKAMTHLLDVGRRRILFLGSIEHPEIELRYRGAQRAMAEALKVGIDAQLTQTPASFTIESGYRTVKALLSKETFGFDGILAASDAIAMGAIRALESAGHKIPRDISVVGYDDVPMARYFNPTLTTVRQNMAEGAHALVTVLLEILQGRPARSVLLDGRLVVRGSCGGEPTQEDAEEDLRGGSRGISR
ncbi:LacI family DNA-binding transcriptional regulator [Yunchengibacter salinarum]|uniref:LacI family DNA-binding transcriptional regulator n=1 Tax=Yunchengibacter salinarum TaxID=3133399 RepID=UPI0035B583A8